MNRLLVVPALRLDALAPHAADAPDHVVEVLLRRPAVVVSLLAAAADSHAVDGVALLDPVCGTSDGGYAVACIAALRADLARRGVTCVTVDAAGAAALGIPPVAGGVELLDPADGTVPTASGVGGGLGVVIDVGAGTAVPVVVDPIVHLDVRLSLPAGCTPAHVVEELTAAGRAACAAHPDRFVIATAHLDADGAGRRLLQWPGIIERATHEVRQAGARSGLPLWWDELAVVARGGGGLIPGGPAVHDALVADLLGLPPIGAGERPPGDGDEEAQPPRPLAAPLVSVVPRTAPAAAAAVPGGDGPVPADPSSTDRITVGPDPAHR